MHPGVNASPRRNIAILIQELNRPIGGIEIARRERCDPGNEHDDARVGIRGELRRAVQRRCRLRHAGRENEHHPASIETDG
jgi:hypothetical protein